MCWSRALRNRSSCFRPGVSLVSPETLRGCRGSGVDPAHGRKIGIAIVTDAIKRRRVASEAAKALWNDVLKVTKLPDLAIVCATCHVLIHIGGECRLSRGWFRSFRTCGEPPWCVDNPILLTTGRWNSLYLRTAIVSGDSHHLNDTGDFWPKRLLRPTGCR
jgi:hypothetical protein